MNYSFTVWVSIFGIIAYIALSDPNFPRLYGAIYGKFSVSWRSFLFDLRWNPRHFWIRAYIYHVAKNNAETNTILLRKELGLPLED